MPKAKKYIPKGKLGTGKRQKQLTKHLAARKGKRKVTNPKALASWIGRRLYGDRYNKWAAAGRKRAAAKRKRATTKRRKA
jgi:hypothetical protein